MDFEKLYQIVPKDPIKWTTEDVGKWLSFINLQQYFEAFQSATIDGACLSHITDEDLLNDLGIKSRIIRKKLLNWLHIGIKEYSLFLKTEQKMEQEQITYSDIQFNVFSKQCMENDLMTSNNMIPTENMYPSNNNLYSKQNTSQIEIEDTEPMLQKKEHSDDNFTNNNDIDLNFNYIPQQHNILTENNQLMNQQIEPQSQQFQVPKTKQNNIKKQSKQINNIVSNNINDFNGNNNLQLYDEETKMNKLNDQNNIVSNDNNNNNINKEKPQISNNILDENTNMLIEKARVQKKLVIQPQEGPQANFYCITHEGGKIGRHSSNQILILEESISRFHAEIQYKQDQFYIQDIGSTTGTFIKILEKQVLEKGMIVEMGSNQFLVNELIYPSPDNNKAELKMILIEGDNMVPNTSNEYNLTFDKAQQRYNLGRKSNNEMCFPDDQHLSNQHSRFYFRNSQFILEDLQSLNGSWIRISQESKKSELFPLGNNTVFKIGTTSTYVCSLEQEQTAEYNIENNCVICCDNDRNALYLPCNHNAACIKCSKTLKECPICRVKIEDFIRIYKS